MLDGDETGPSHQIHQLGWLGEVRQRLRQVAVRSAVGEEAADGGNGPAEPQCVAGREQHLARRGDVEERDPAARAEDPRELREHGSELDEVPEGKRGDSPVEAAARERQCGRVTLDDERARRCEAEHARGQVDAECGDVASRESGEQVTWPGRQVEDQLARGEVERVQRASTPGAVEVEGEEAVELLVAGGDPVEHRLDGGALVRPGREACHDVEATGDRHRTQRRLVGDDRLRGLRGTTERGGALECRNGVGHLRSRLVLASMIAACALVSCARPARMPAQAAGQAIPWIDEPAVPPARPLPRPQVAAPVHGHAPACAAKALSVTALWPVQATQDGGILVELRNTGRVACLLAGTPTVAATAPGGARVLASPEALPSLAQPAYTVPGGSVWLRVDAPLACPRDPSGTEHGLRSYHRLVVSLPEGGELEIGGVGLRFPCGMSTTPFYALRPAPSATPDALADLVPRLTLPRRTPAPGTLRYEVTLSNPGSRAVELSPCPVYVESSSIPTKFLYRLNCSQVRSIPAHGEVTYRMEMTIPATAGLGPVRVRWSLVGPGARAAGGRVELG